MPENALSRLSSSCAPERRPAHSKPLHRRGFCPRHLRPASRTSVAGDDPVNESDPSGQATVGYCGGAAGAFLGAKGFANACLTRVVFGGPDEIGPVETAGGGGPKLIVGGGVQVALQISNATSLKDLTGPFAYWELDVQTDIPEYPLGASVVVFAGKSSENKSIWGIDLAAGLDFNLARQIPGVPVLVGDGADYSWAQVFHHWWEWGPADVAWDGVGVVFGQPPVRDLLALAEKLLNQVKNTGQGPFVANDEGTTRIFSTPRAGGPRRPGYAARP